MLLKISLVLVTILLLISCASPVKKVIVKNCKDMGETSVGIQYWQCEEVK